ncbi:hypothetical protein D8Y22_00910 [Salinadaptatus halalkaliphilus]|uniref:Uncharacterized protein n=1 Tax=Salinadaptatus halalkaliphilus TaxID=2419781 RepID=A0A4S3TQX5_9EURY|nr:hypothetical protein [Salinadaptatus halalkaliphilus]THE66716.1 hypothetical protein D8Y22_00910 [Salinadaptatus halalkaliphilus]
MTPPETTRDSTRQPSFEDALEALVVSAFANNERVEGEWQIVTPLTAAPNWLVTVEKVYDDEEPAYDPDLLE